MNLRYRAAALEDIHTIYAWRSRQSPEVAERVEAAIFATVDWLATHPTLGTKTDEANVRRWPMTDLRYAIFYSLDQDADTLDVLRIVDGRRLRDTKHSPRGNGN